MNEPWPGAPQVCAKHYLAPEKGPKYRNRKSESLLIGRSFQSRAERDYCELLTLREKAGEITDLRFQPRYDFAFGGIVIGWYHADADYLERGGLHVIDVKGHVTEAYRMRVKLMAACHGIVVEEVRRAGREWDSRPVKLRRTKD